MWLFVLRTLVYYIFVARFGAHVHRRALLVMTATAKAIATYQTCAVELHHMTALFGTRLDIPNLVKVSTSMMTLIIKYFPKE
jgi:hypothetical protein